MIRLEPWCLGVSGSGYVLRDPDNLVQIEIHKAEPHLNPIIQLIEIEKSLGLSIELLRERIVASVDVGPEGAFRLRSRLGPWGGAGLIDEVMVIDPRLWFRGSCCRWQ